MSQDFQFLFFFFFCFWGLHPGHMDVLRLGVEIGATAVGLHHSHSNTGSKPYLWPTPQLMATQDPPTHWARPEIKPVTSWLLDSFPLHHNENSKILNFFITIFILHIPFVLYNALLIPIRLKRSRYDSQSTRSWKHVLCKYHQALEEQWATSLGIDFSLLLVNCTSILGWIFTCNKITLSPLIWKSPERKAILLAIFRYPGYLFQVTLIPVE